MKVDSQPSSHSRLRGIIERCRGREVWIIGDLMLDEYVHGDVERVSPEAPVPVVRAGEIQHRLGGAGNVARQLAALGCRAVLGGVVGRDTAGQELIGACESVGIEVRGIYQDPVRRTTRKLRVLGHGQQLVRLDWEDAAQCNSDVASAIFERMRSGPRPEIVILSDYAKGVVTDAVIAAFTQFARESGCRVLVDPKRADLTEYRGANLLTPNLGELKRSVRRKLDPDDNAAIAAAARFVIEPAALDGIVITLSERGMLYVGADGETYHVPAVRRDVADVTGAGDTVMAVLAACLAAGATMSQAMTIANAAAGLAVAQIGAVSVAPEQIGAALAGMSSAKVMGRRALAASAAAWRASGKRIVFTNGCFDLLHSGHLSLLHEAAKLGDVLILAINSDASVRRLKGAGRPILPENDRAALLAALACVDAVTIFDEETPVETLRAVRPHALVKGQDYSVAEVVGREIVEADGGHVVLVPLLEAWSTSTIIERIRTGSGYQEAS